MGVTLRSNVDASAYAEKAITAVSRGLLGMYFFDTSLSKVGNDFGITSNAKGSIVGNPVVSADKTRFQASANYLQTDIPEPTDFTFAMVMRTLYNNADASADAAKRALGVSSYDVTGGASSGMMLGYASNRLTFGRRAFSGAGDSLIYVEMPATVDPMAWALYWGTFNSATGILKVVADTANWSGTTGGPTYTAKKSPRKISVGANALNASTQLGPVEISQLRLHGVTLDEASEISPMLAEMRRYELTHNNRTV